MKTFLLVLLLSSGIFYAQEEHAWIYFKNKPGVEAALEDPSSILSEKALRRKALRGTPIDSRDVPVNEDYIATIKSRKDIKIWSKSKWMNCVHVTGTREAITALNQLEFVSRVSFRRNRLNSRLPSESKRNSAKLESHEDFIYGPASNQTRMLSTELLHKQGYTGNGITIAVMDAGFPNVDGIPAFESLRLENRLLGGYDFPNRSHHFTNPNLSEHGTLVLSTMAGIIDRQFTGTAPDASYYLFITEIGPTETPVEESYWVEAAERADSLGVDLINTSLGYSLFDDPDYSYAPEDMNGTTSFISKAANIATEKGMLVVVSAGNRGNKNYFNIIGAPADANVLSVGATDGDRNYATFSSPGPTADGRIKPDVAAQGLGIAAINSSNRLVQVNGTSFASPILAGSIASFWQMDPSLTNLEIMQLVREISDRYQSPTYELGFGIPNFEKALETIQIARNNNELFLYQNPVYGVLKFNNPTKESFKLSIFDTLGQMVLQKDRLEENIDISSLARGIYITVFEQSDFRKSFIIIKK